MNTNDHGTGGPNATDHSLALRVKDGDQEAARDLYERYVQRVFGLVDSKLGAKLRATTDAEDIVQSVFRSMFRGMQAGSYGVEPGSTLWNLLAVISLTKLRRRAHHQTAQRRDVDRLVSLQTIADGEAAAIHLLAVAEYISTLLLEGLVLAVESTSRRSPISILSLINWITVAESSIVMEATAAEGINF